MSSAPIPSGDIQFYDNYKPALPVGEAPYTLTATQTLASTGGEALAQTITATQKFWISAPRFALDPAEIQSLFPPANSSGFYDLKLANIVLKERSFPWERMVGASPNTPWVALLVFAEDEIILPGATTGHTNPTRTASCAVSEFINSSDPTILNLGSILSAQPGDPATCQTIKISTATFDTIVPRIDDLPWLAHVRQVNTDNKTTAQAIGNGWFSVVIANRFPAEPSGGVGRYIAHLVSLEGYADYLTDTPPTWPEGVTSARLASLASWTFQSRADGLDFKALMSNLTGAPGGADLRLRLPGPATAPPAGTPAADAANALGQGYTALPYETRVGDETFAWYHGPLVPYPVNEVPITGPFTSASAATAYDPASGTFDLSYAACWEVGRMLALRDRAYATAQQRSNAALTTTINLLRERARWQAGAPHATLLKPQRVSRSLGGALRVLASSIPQPGQPVAAPPPPRPPAPPAPPPFEALSAAFADPALADTIGAQIAAAPPQSPTDSVVDWLAKLRLLEPVPFVHLVPDARMLPAESIRFFYVDSNALDALSDGAQSIGVGTSRDAAQVQLARPAMREAVIARASARRATLLGQATAAVLPTDPFAGFLLRSAAVSGWPGLEVKAWSDMAGTQEILPLRCDHLASDVLLVLYPQLPVRIDVEEPKEGLAFGVEDEWAVDLRYVSGANVGVQIPKVSATLDPSYRPGGVLQVDKWQAYLATLFPNDTAIWGPAAFALQMVSAPEQMIFDNGATS